MPRKRLGPTEVSYSTSHLGEVYSSEITKVPQAYPSLLPLLSHSLFLHLLPLVFGVYGIAFWTELPPSGVKITGCCLQSLVF
ncbi:hypothetical protein L6164_006754 [Bauhinia variegata]|uniref:Uncharacterized protein n=1 Tax=Bauhinia variegata TaxID=167791 RepID=A0ACB9PUU8_BAUVA|nr:hypothetical protein L6164_006754 [Bauhinia variegata]